MASYDTTKLTNLAALKSLAEKIKETYAKQTDLETLQGKVDGLVTAGGEPNKIEKIKVNGTEQDITDKSVDIKVPTKVGELTNDKKYQTDTDVSTAIQTAISKAGHASFKVVTALPEASAAEDNILYLYKNADSGYYDIYAKVTEDGSAKLLRLDDTTVDLSAYSTTAQIEAAYVKKDGSKVLSTNDYTTAEKTKLSGIKDGATKTAKSTTNGNILIDGAQTVVYTHPDTAGNKHIPTGGAAGQILEYGGASGTAKWVTPPEIAQDSEITQMLTEVFGN